ncbi:MAG: hypothetical protein ACRDY0_13580, partial [Acidimicrobiales bacterium]
AGANPTISLTDTTAGTTTNVPVSVMQGVTSGESDLHYGNNIVAPVGHSFVVNVSLNGEKAALHFTRTS